MHQRMQPPSARSRGIDAATAPRSIRKDTHVRAKSQLESDLILGILFEFRDFTLIVTVQSQLFLILFTKTVGFQLSCGLQNRNPRKKSTDR